MNEALRLFLADRDTPCPSCRYNLRGLQGTTCPECARGLELTLESACALPRLGIAVFTLISLGTLNLVAILLLWSLAFITPITLGLFTIWFAGGLLAIAGGIRLFRKRRRPEWPGVAIRWLCASVLMHCAYIATYILLNLLFWLL